MIGALRISIARRPEAPRLEAIPIVLPPSGARTLSLSFGSLAADLLWIRFVQEVPTTPADDYSGRALAAELQAIIALDPTFRAPYLHGSTLLSVLGNQPCSALGVLEKGVPRFPDDWRLSFQAGYECFSELGDTECASRHMTRAASIPGSPGWLPGLVGRFLAVNHRTDASIDYLRNALAHTEDPRLKSQFEERLRQALLTADLERLDDAIRAWRLQHDGAMPASLEALVAAGIVPAIPPTDPVGGHFEIGPSGRARSSTGQGKLHPHRREGGFSSAPIEKLLPERIVVRAPVVLGHPLWLFYESDRIASAAGVLDFAIQGMSLALENADDADERANLQVLIARTIMASDVERLKKSQIEILRTSASASVAIENVVSAAGIPDHDPFGTPYQVDTDGRAGPGKGAHPMVNVRGHGVAACQ